METDTYNKSVYHVVSWETSESVHTTQTLSRAKKYARDMGHNGKPWGNWYAPLAFVAYPHVDFDNVPVYKRWAVVYNPRFKVGK